MSNDRKGPNPGFVPSPIQREAAASNRRSRTRGHTGRVHASTGLPLNPRTEASKSNGDRRYRPRTLAAAGVATVLGIAALVYAGRPSGDEGLAAQEEAKALVDLGLQRAAETGEPVRANLVPAVITLGAGTAYQTEPPTYLDAQHPGSFSEALEEPRTLTRPMIVEHRDQTFLVAYPENSEDLNDANWYPLTRGNAENMQVKLSGGVPINRPLTYADFAYGFGDEGLDANHQIDGLYVNRDANGSFQFSFIREGQRMQAMSSVDGATSTDMNPAMRVMPLETATFPEA